MCTALIYVHLLERVEFPKTVLENVLYICKHVFGDNDLICAL